MANKKQIRERLTMENPTPAPDASRGAVWWLDNKKYIEAREEFIPKGYCIRCRKELNGGYARVLTEFNNALACDYCAADILGHQEPN